jgi:hypothetical protein
MSVIVPVVAAIHLVLSLSILVYLHLLKVRGCACATSHPAFCRLYTTAWFMVIWRTVVVGLRIHNPSAILRNAEGNLNVAWAVVSGAIFIVFYAAFVKFAYDLSRSAGASGACACRADDPTMRVLNTASVTYAAVTGVTFFIALSIFIGILATMPKRLWNKI